VIEEASLRLPLQTGASALRDLLVGALTFIPGYAIAFGSLLGIALWPAMLGVTAYTAVFGAFLSVVGGRSLYRVLDHRPTDLVLGADGVHVEGGPHEITYGEPVPWKEIVREAWHVRRNKQVSELVTGAADFEIVLASATELSEAWSLQAIADTVCQTAEQRTNGVPAAAEVTSLACPACGAPARADDAESVACEFCRSRVPVPAGARERIRAARRVGVSDRVTPLLIRRFLAQPSARALNAIGLFAAACMFAAWPAVIGLGAWLYSEDLFGGMAVTALVLFAPASIWAMYTGASATIANRRALQLVGLGLTAARTAAGAAECRLCGAVLQQSSELVVACGYCASPNVLGIDLRRRVRDAVADEQELQAALAANADRQRDARVQVLLAIGCMVLAAVLFAVGCLTA
jgi:hypothetical protein